MTYLLFYLFLALLYVAVMLMLRKALESNGVRGKYFWGFTFAGAVLAPIMIVITTVYASLDMLKRAWLNRNSNE